MILQLHDIPVPTDTLYAECHVDAAGEASVADLIATCSRYGIRVQAFRNATETQVRQWLGDGFVVTLLPSTSSGSHAICMYGSNLLVADTHSRVHPADPAKFRALLLSGAPCLVASRPVLATAIWLDQSLAMLAVFLFSVVILQLPLPSARSVWSRFVVKSPAIQGESK
jgi:hypothetical protein